MKIEGTIFASGAAFFGVVALAYWLLSKEPAGAIALALSGGLLLLIAFYLLHLARHIDLRPEDRLDAEVEDGTGELGFFSPHSWWPLALAASLAVLTLGVVFSWWLLLLGVGMLGLSAMGFVFEYYRGPSASQER